jgi:hypothetical protein
MGNKLRRKCEDGKLQTMESGDDTDRVSEYVLLDRILPS